MKSRIVILTGILMLSLFSVRAQDSNEVAVDTNLQIKKLSVTVSTEKSYEIRPFQVTLVTPLGTNGYKSHESINYFSWNIIAGYNGGVDGMELGGFANVLQYNMHGTQIAGFSNMVRGNVEGIQVAGFSNIVNTSVTGVQIGGFTNHVHESSRAIQVAGFSNQVLKSLSGAQIGGFMNYVKDSLEGIQVAGFANVTGPVANGFQVSGFLNVAQESMKGAQVAGFANVSGNLDGVQVSGFINKAKKVEGYQIGFINLADSFSQGAPIGFFSSVVNGYKNFSFGFTDYQFVEAQYRTGTERFHNIFAATIGPVKGHSGWGFGYGLGTALYNGKRIDLLLDGVLYYIAEDEIWSNSVNNLLKVSTRLSYHPTGKRFGIWAAPSMNYQVISNERFSGEIFESNLAPYTILTDEGRYFTNKLWAGLQAGIVF